jgi:hypothetical protein
MGKQRNIRLRLTIGDLSFYERLNEWLMRKKPERVNRSRATIKVGGQFGKASTMGRLLRGSLLPLIAVTNTKRLERRLVAALYQWRLHYTPESPLPQNELPGVTGFEFDEGCPFSACIRLPFIVSRTSGNRLVLHIPAFNPAATIKAPPQTSTVQFIIAAASCNADTKQCTFYKVPLSIPFTGTTVAAQDILLDIQTGRQCVAAVAVAVRFYTRKNSQSERRPAALIAAFCH